MAPSRVILECYQNPAWTNSAPPLMCAAERRGRRDEFGCVRRSPGAKWVQNTVQSVTKSVTPNAMQNPLWGRHANYELQRLKRTGGWDRPTVRF